MSFHIMPGCCAWRVYHGITKNDWTVNFFKQELCKGLHSKKPAILFNAAYGSNADGQVNDKETVMKRCEQLMNFIENNELGDVYELPQFQNHGGGRIVPIVWIVNKAGLNRAVGSWATGAFKI